MSVQLAKCSGSAAATPRPNCAAGQSAPPAGSAFRGMKSGFLNSDKAQVVDGTQALRGTWEERRELCIATEAKRRGLPAPKAAQEAGQR